MIPDQHGASRCADFFSRDLLPAEQLSLFCQLSPNKNDCNYYKNRG